MMRVLPSEEGSGRSRYGKLRESGIGAFFEGRLSAAVRAFEEAAGVARETGDADLASTALANWATAALLAGTPPPPPTRLREALGRSREPASRYLCASALVKLYQESHDLRKATFYARVALGVAPGRHLAAAEQSLGVTLLARGDCRGALPHLRRALDSWPCEAVPVAVSLSVFAYLWSLLGNRRDAARATETTLGHLGDLQCGYPPHYREPVHLNLGFSMIETGDPERALHHAEQALETGRGLGRVPCHEHKMALYLAGEAALEAGCAEAGWHYVDRLQRTYYPDQGDLRDLLVAVRTSGMVNWLA